MRGKMARSDPRPSVRITRGAGSGQHLASDLQEGRENANIDAGLGFIRRISVYMPPFLIVVPYRSREGHLKSFVPHLRAYFARDKSDRHIPFKALN